MYTLERFDLSLILESLLGLEPAADHGVLGHRGHVGNAAEATVGMWRAHLP